MIRINLLEGTGRQADTAPPTGSAARFQARVFLLTLLAAAVLTAAAYTWVSYRKSMLDSQLATENAEAARLAAIGRENARYEAQLRDIERRMVAIQSLEDNRQGPGRLMSLVADAVNRAPGLYLESVTPKNDRLIFAGTSRSVIAIASLVAALESAPDAHDVELREYYENDQKDGEIAYKFNVDCKFQPAANRAPRQTEAAPATRRPTAAHSS